MTTEQGGTAARRLTRTEAKARPRPLPAEVAGRDTDFAAPQGGLRLHAHSAPGALSTLAVRLREHTAASPATVAGPRAAAGAATVRPSP